MNTKSIRRTLAALATVASLGLAGAAQATVFNFDHDSADLVHARASLTLGAVNWGQEIGGNRIQGRLTGLVNYHGVVAGCARVKVIWKDAAGNALDNDFSPQVCSNSSAPAVPVSFADSAFSNQLRKATVVLQLKDFNSSSFVNIASRSMEAGGQ